MAPLSLLAFALGLGHTTIATPINVAAHQLARRDPPDATDPDSWCKNIDWNNADDAQMVWEDWGVGNWFDTWLSG